jgi:hypothetical protein
MSESVILCEGYHDRAFWKGWLEYLGCTDPGIPPGGRTGRVPIIDPWNDEVKGGGQYAYHSKSSAFVRIRPCDGKSRILREARNRLNLRATKALLRLVINIDADLTASGANAAPTGLQLTDVVQFARTFYPSASINPDGEIDLDGGATKISLVRWEVLDPPTPGLPDRQTLERLVSAAQAAAYPARAASVQQWLDARPAPPAADPKEHAWSYMVGWHAEHGCEAFYSNQWHDHRVVAELESRLRSSRAWQIAERLAN